MDRTELDRLEHLLSRKGELVSAVLLLVPLVVELMVRYGAGLGLILWVTLSSVYGLLQILRQRTALRKEANFRMVMLGYFTTFTIFVWLVSTPISPLVFLAVMLSTFVAYVFSRQGELWTILIINLIIITSFVVHRGMNITLLSFAELLSTVSIMSLLIIFVTSLVRLNQDEISELNQTYKQLRAEHLRLVSLVNTLGDGIISTDSEGRVQTYNGAALELLDTNASLSGKKLDDIWDLIDAEGQPVKLIEESQKANISYRRSDLIIRYGENDQANLYVNVTPLKIGFGQDAQQGYTFIIRDITKEKSLDEERDEFISVVSHELRTPITITEGKISNAQLLIDRPRAPKKRIKDSLDAAHQQVVFLSNMINDLASLARAEREDAEIDLEQVEPARLVSDLVRGYQVEADRKGLGLSYHLPRTPLPNLYSSRLYIQEILQNFITNAIKYTQNGGITVSAVSTKDGGVRFAVSDTGIGISTSDQKKIFDKFFRSEDYRTRENGGTGLGLYVTQKLAKKINAKIEFESKIDKGSTFYLSVLPMPENKKR